MKRVTMSVNEIDQKELFLRKSLPQYIKKTKTAVINHYMRVGYRKDLEERDSDIPGENEVG